VAQLVNIAGKNTGKDVSVTITDSQGNQYTGAQLGIMTHFEVKAKYSLPETKSIINNGAVFYESIPHGLTCMMKFSRYGNGLEQFEQNYRNNSNNGIMLSYTIQYQTVNRDNTVNTSQLSFCKPHDWDLGAYQADQDVTQSVTWECTDTTAA
jgi:hypothetical protein